LVANNTTYIDSIIALQPSIFTSTPTLTIHRDGGNATVFGLAHCTELLAPAEDAFGHRPARLRHAIAFMPRGPSVDGALAARLPVEVTLSFVTLMARRLAT
jgi:hypothetical protein